MNGRVSVEICIASVCIDYFPAKIDRRDKNLNATVFYLSGTCFTSVQHCSVVAIIVTWLTQTKSVFFKRRAFVSLLCKIVCKWPRSSEISHGTCKQSMKRETLIKLQLQ